jgi:hypothetical protein
LRQELEQRIPELVRQYFPEGDVPVTIRWPENNFPTSLCIGSFESEPIALPQGDGYSFLVICWFVWHVDRTMREVITPGLSGWKWEDFARDYSWW